MREISDETINKMVEKYPLLLAGDENVFVDPTLWNTFLDGCAQRLADLIEKDPL